MICVRDLALQPDVPRQHLNANILLVASYQKNPASAKNTAPVKNAAPPPKSAAPAKNIPAPSAPAKTSTVKAK
jgi:hypothetical protein